MQEIISFERPCRAIIHFAEDEQIAAQHGARLIYYQVEIDTAPESYSPDKEFIRFDHHSSEVHGWIKVESIVIDTVLEEYIQEEDQWQTKKTA